LLLLFVEREDLYHDPYRKLLTSTMNLRINIPAVEALRSRRQIHAVRVRFLLYCPAVFLDYRLPGRSPD